MPIPHPIHHLQETARKALAIGAHPCSAASVASGDDDDKRRYEVARRQFLPCHWRLSSSWKQKVEQQLGPERVTTVDTPLWAGVSF